MRIFVIGAAGGIGRRLTACLTAAGDEVSGMHRRPEQAATIRSAGGTPVSGDLIEDSVDVLAGHMRGHAAVVFSAGAHGTGMDQTTLIDGEGLTKAARAALAAGVRRFVLVSALPSRGAASRSPSSDSNTTWASRRRPMRSSSPNPSTGSSSAPAR